MGCDIHMQVEVFDAWRVGNGKDRDEWRLVIDEIATYWERNYKLFALLAGVRNYDGIRPIAEPRGLPADVSEGAKARSDLIGVDGHSHSWLLLSEVMADARVDGIFRQWLVALKDGPTRLRYRSPEHIRLVFWFDN